MRDVPVVELKNVSFTYGCHPVLDNISLTIGSGEAVGLVGPNGAGKTTLLKIILGQLKPQAGTVQLFGQDVSKFKERYKIGYVSQRAVHFNPQFPATVREVVASGRVARRGLFRPLTRTDYSRVDRALELVGLRELSKQPVGILSGGQQQRVFIARSLVAEPAILILDEPTVGIDPAAQTSLYKLLRHLNQKEQMTLLIVSHEMEGLSSVITRQVCLDRYVCTCQCRTAPLSQLREDTCTKRLVFQVAE
ncbi:metal ABC transporter ATP-binding protein [Desulforamulus putei]|uniref:Zinc transport system ATP-binding protein n=1 Tax=Desulforamulus putei DSM 12395 TaxID=1121429 RepID=A0A1M4W255_9FIRM|nr:metal ABC transporter ATP-binding protein [Desulforamulus putei]SHE75296.1 zinc transport system ATP-binding protein [Desulforamulus putei DSM 12395]